MSDPLFNVYLLYMRIVNLERRRLAAAVDRQNTVNNRPMRTVFIPFYELLQDPRVVGRYG